MPAALTARDAATLAQLSVVVPVGPADPALAGLLPELKRLPEGCERIIVPVAGDPAFAHDPAIVVSPAPRGRARQLNHGAALATRPWLWFLHADSRFCADTVPALARFLRGGEAALGYFDLRFRDDGPALVRINQAGAFIRSRLLGLPFGDQGLVLPRAVFDRLGGFDERLDCGEDHRLVWRAHQAGVAVRPLGAALLTSARRYREHGWLRTTARHLWLTARQAAAARKPPR